MEIENKEIVMAELRRMLEKHIRQFPIYFYGNIIFNTIIIVAIIAVAIFSAFSLSMLKDLRMLVYGSIMIAFLTSVFSVTILNFFKNVRILHAIQAGHFDLNIEDYELDHALHFIEQLPMSKEEVEHTRVGLSFGKLIDILDLFGMIKYEGNMCDLDIVFKYELERLIAEEKDRQLVRTKNL